MAEVINVAGVEKRVPSRAEILVADLLEGGWKVSGGSLARGSGWPVTGAKIEENGDVTIVTGGGSYTFKASHIGDPAAYNGKRPRTAHLIRDNLGAARALLTLLKQPS